MKKLLILMLILLSFACVKPPKINSALNWSTTNHLMAPGAVAVTVDAKRPYCSGVLIKPNVVMTAGHCLDDFKAKRMYITHGCSHIGQETCTHTRVKLKIFNPNFDYTPGIWNDVGILITEKNITSMEPAKIGTFQDVRRSKGLGRDLITAGFGKRQNGDVGILYMGKVRIREQYLYEFLTQDNGYNGPCKGDSGGPAYYRDYDGEIRVVGILSRSRREGVTCGGKAKYTIPILYMDWVEEVSNIAGEMYDDKG